MQTDIDFGELAERLRPFIEDSCGDVADDVLSIVATDFANVCLEGMISGLRIAGVPEEQLEIHRALFAADPRMQYAAPEEPANA